MTTALNERRGGGKVDRNETRPTAMSKREKEPDISTYKGRFAARLRILRKRKGLSVPDFCDRLTQNGVEAQPPTAYGWEIGKTLPSISTLPAIAATLGCEVRHLLPPK
ncbi:MAG: helix-turn-helix transcriptional regulator [Pseudomonadota bacterium]